MNPQPIDKIEWITLGVLALCYGGLVAATVVLPPVSAPLAFVVTAFFIALHSSLQHEALHGHPTRLTFLNELLVFPAVGLFVPYGRFRDLHLAHHIDDRLTDPFDDPESNFKCPIAWPTMPRWQRVIWRVNNTLAGRMLLGPALSVVTMIRADIVEIRNGASNVTKAWLLHVVGLVPVIWFLSDWGTIGWGSYLAAAYFGLSLLKIRTYLEHRVHRDAKGRTVVIEDRGLLAFLFLNNNYHIVHHSHPGQPWYRMRQLYYGDPQKYRDLNDGYVYPSYLAIFRQYFLRAKDPVAHPDIATVRKP